MISLRVGLRYHDVCCGVENQRFLSPNSLVFNGNSE